MISNSNRRHLEYLGDVVVREVQERLEQDYKVDLLARAVEFSVGMDSRVGQNHLKPALVLKLVDQAEYQAAIADCGDPAEVGRTVQRAGYLVYR